MDKRLNKFRINLSKDWIDVSDEDPDGRPTFIKDKVDEPGVLQISLAEYVKGKLPNPDYATLIDLSEDIGLRNNFGQIINKESGNCRYGKYGFVEFSNPDFPYLSVSHQSNGKDFIFSTYICPKMPGVDELNEVKGILTTIKTRRTFFDKFWK